MGADERRDVPDDDLRWWKEQERIDWATFLATNVFFALIAAGLLFLEWFRH